MSKFLRLTPELIEQSCDKYKAALSAGKVSDGKFSYTECFEDKDRKATVYFTADAWTKMVALIHQFNDEVAWHGVAERIEGEGDNYLISDILVYPQEVSAATVNTDQQEYEKWMMDLDDNTFNNLRFQGHSHVRISPTPSTVDLTHQKKIVEQLEDDMFYIFMIWNKEFKYTAKIYDMKKNALFETNDVEVQMVNSSTGLSKFITEAKSMVKRKTYQYSGGSGQGTYTGGGTHNYHDTYQQNKNAGGTTTPATQQGGWRNEQTASPSQVEGLSVRPKPQIGNGWSGVGNSGNNAGSTDNDYPDYDDDYFDRPYHIQ